jgi:hypothetical protein
MPNQLANALNARGEASQMSRNSGGTRSKGTLRETLILSETKPSSDTVSASSAGSSTIHPELGTTRIESEESNHPSMAKLRRFRVLVVTPGADPTVVHDAVTAVAANDRSCVDELHVLTSSEAADRLRAILLKSAATAALAARCRRLGIAKADIIFNRRAIHGLGGSGAPRASADDVLNILRKLCGDSMNDVTVVVSSDAGALAILAHSALELVGKPTDRFFVLNVRPTARGGSRHRRGREARVSRPALLEVPTILVERPVPSSQSYNELATSRRLARQRLAEPGILVLDGSRRAIRIDDVELVLPRLRFFWMFCLATLTPNPLPLRVLSGNFDVDVDGSIAIVLDHPQRAHLEVLVRHMRRVFVTLFPKAGGEFPFMLQRACGANPGLPSVISKLNADLKRALGVGAGPYLIAGGRGTAGYRLALAPAQIELAPVIRVSRGPRQGADD